MRMHFFFLKPGWMGHITHKEWIKFSPELNLLHYLFLLLCVTLFHWERQRTVKFLVSSFHRWCTETAVIRTKAVSLAVASRSSAQHVSIYHFKSQGSASRAPSRHVRMSYKKLSFFFFSLLRSQSHAWLGTFAATELPSIRATSRLKFNP